MSAQVPGSPSVRWPSDRLFGSAQPATLGLWVFLLSDWLCFAGLLLANGVLRVESSVWRRPGEPSLHLLFGALLTWVLALSSVTALRASEAAARGAYARAGKWLAVTGGLGALFLAGQSAEWATLLREGLRFGRSAYASAFFAITGFHGLHVVAALLFLLVVGLRSARGRTSAEEVALLVIFWHFVDFVWNLVFVLLYLLPGRSVA